MKKTFSSLKCMKSPRVVLTSVEVTCNKQCTVRMVFTRDGVKETVVRTRSTLPKAISSCCFVVFGKKEHQRIFCAGFNVWNSGDLVESTVRVRKGGVILLGTGSSKDIPESVARGFFSALGGA
jgi:hypothetical protein